ncbi:MULTISPECIES: hypothetical protein [Rhodopseudomonas]|uniref:Uncharacterized protein n=1 Tax=Rhodopseudomonas palustris TaxID=1076 RepID=A0A0D7E317_RHOPL|nr:MULTISPECIES: hypothetical protein [Rhodopseudomonas]KIZ34906.1 hypothetical protein OO17_26235 [Rhodopseudomonas palustris]MDF3811256.1 hypothetical protein [Rhodopseudomonas sp. BAL398]WOK18581.1 hypothetical protein RBJ75_03370 [Rhodopseudomonas sp. BAL398]
MAQHPDPNHDRPVPNQPGPDPIDQSSTSRFREPPQVDPELVEGPASRGRIAAFALAIVLVLGAVFYGLTAATTTPDAASTASQNAPQNQTDAQNSPTNPAATSPAIRDVTPYNREPGTTTGAAPSQPSTSSAPADRAPQ